MKPKPPEGFIPFKWKTIKTKDGDVQNICPVCGLTGSYWNGGGFQDPEVEKAANEQEARDIPFYDCKAPDGSDLKMHWSRWGSGYCLECGCEFWNDFQCDHSLNCSCGAWHYYYREKQQEVLSKWV